MTVIFMYAIDSAQSWYEKKREDSREIRSLYKVSQFCFESYYACLCTKLTAFYGTMTMHDVTHKKKETRN